MASLVVSVINMDQRFDKPGVRLMYSELNLKVKKLKFVSRGGLKLEKALQVLEFQ